MAMLLTIDYYMFTDTTVRPFRVPLETLVLRELAVLLDLL